MKKTNTKDRRVKAKRDRQVVEFFVKQGQCLMPMLELIETSRIAVDELIDVVGRSAVEAILQMSAQQVAGKKRQGRHCTRAAGLRWYGTQPGSVRLSDRKLRVIRPRLRNEREEVEIPAYEALRHNQRLGIQMLTSLLSGVSTRDYQKLLREMAATAGVSKSSVSREFVEQSAAQLQTLTERRFEQQQFLVIYLDGMSFGEHQLIAAVAVDQEGNKHVLGVTLGSTENAVVAKGLLLDLVERGLDPTIARLFVIDGSKALRKAIREIFGAAAVVQRCRAHKLRNVMAYLPKHLQPQVAAVMRAAYKLSFTEGVARLQTQAKWLQRSYPQAAASLLEGLEETFTINRLGLSTVLRRCLASTNIIESPNGAVRSQTRRISRWRDGTMVLRWAASAFLKAEKSFKRVHGYRDLWMLENALKPSPQGSCEVRVA